MGSDYSAVPATATTLAHRIRGSGRRVVLVHGFSQTGECMGPLADDLAADHEVVLPDAPGHGLSERHLDPTVPQGAQLLADTCGPSVWVGYSMGGRFCLQMALDRPEVVEALVLIGATPGIADPDERAERRARDLALADRLERIGTEEFVEEWLQLPLFAGLPRWARFDDERRSNSVAGLAGHLRNAGTGSMEPLWDRLGDLAVSGVPVVAVAGELDERYGDIAGRTAEAAGRNARAVVVPRAGHAAHLECPDEVTAIVRSVLSSL